MEELGITEVTKVTEGTDWCSISIAPKKDVYIFVYALQNWMYILFEKKYINDVVRCLMFWLVFKQKVLVY